MKLILFPLGCLILLSLLSMTGLGDTLLGDITLEGDPSETLYYDEGGHGVVYANGTAAGEAGSIVTLYGFPYAYWSNATLMYYQLYWDNGGERNILAEDIGKTEASASGLVFSSQNAIGLIILITGLLILAGVVGIRILGSGISDISVGTIILGTSYLAIWGVFSVLSLDLVVAGGDLIMPIAYFVLTAIYCVGIVGQIGGNGND